MKNIHFILSENIEITKKAGTIEIKLKKDTENPGSAQSIPVKQSYGLIVMNRCTLTNQLATLLKQEQIPIAFTEPDGTPLGCFKPFGKTTAKALLKFYTCSQYEPQKNIELKKASALSAIENYIQAMKNEDTNITQQLQKYTTSIIETIKNAEQELTILQSVNDFQQEFHTQITKNSKNIPPAIYTFIKGLLYGLLELSAFHAQLDSRFGLFIQRKNTQILPLIDDLMMIYEGMFIYHFYYKFLQKSLSDTFKTTQSLTIEQKKLITNKFMQFIEKSHKIESLNRPTRLLELPKLQLFLWIKFADGITKKPTIISLKSL